MKKSLLFGTAATLALFTLSPSPVSSLFSPVSQAEAAVNVSFSFGSFYDGLQPYGSWTNYDGRYVFLPRNVAYGWRPYTQGHWVYTDRYGWMWISDEPFGWAPYHYGRWGFANDIGWYWVPGSRWAPAWVYWRRDNSHTAWAPLPPPRRGVDVDINFNIGARDIPDYYWAAVPSRSL